MNRRVRMTAAGAEKRRRRLGLTKKALAARVQMDRNRYARWIRGTGTITPMQRKRLRGALRYDKEARKGKYRKGPILDQALTEIATQYVKPSYAGVPDSVGAKPRQETLDLGPVGEAIAAHADVQAAAQQLAETIIVAVRKNLKAHIQALLRTGQIKTD